MREREKRHPGAEFSLFFLVGVFLLPLWFQLRQRGAAHEGYIM